MNDLPQDYSMQLSSVGPAYIVSQGNIWFAITTGATAGLNYYKEKE